jgi:hypothetical protein
MWTYYIHHGLLWKQERKTPTKGSVEFQKVNNFPSMSHDTLHIQVYKLQGFA